MWSDVRQAFRSLISQPLWTLAAIGCLAIGTGANTASLSVINAILLRPLPFSDPDQLMVVGLRETSPPQNRVFTLAEYREVAPQATLFSQLAARTFLPVSVAAGGQARMVQAELVSANYFEMLRVAPLAGSVPDGPAQAMLSERLWRNRFGSDRTMIGRPIRVNGRDLTVAGIAPAGFSGATQLIAADLWLPADFSGSDNKAEFGAMGRLNPDATREQARSQLDAILAGMGRIARTARVEPATGFGFPLVGRPVAATLFALVGLVTAVAIANVASLMLARTPGRRREIGVRMALGAGAGRITRLILVESLMLGFIGSAIGAAFAAGLIEVIPGLGSSLPEHLTYALDVRADRYVLLYAAFTAVIVSILFGLGPARQAARTNVIDVLKQAGTQASSVASTRALNMLVIAQMAISTALLVGSALLARTYLNTQGADPGIETANVLTAALDLDQVRDSLEAGLRFYQRLLQRVSAMPGVETAALTSEIPLTPGSPRAVSVEAGAKQWSAESKQVTPGYLRTFGIPLRLGRDLSPSDRNAVIVNETMAAQMWPGRSALGQTIRSGSELLEVVGVAKDIKYRSLVESPRAVFYRNFTQYAPRMALVLRSRAASLLPPALRQAVEAENPDLSLVDIRTMDAILENSIAPRRLSAELLAVMCSLGLFLSAAGLYGVVAFGARERTREFGLRMALGARPADIVRQVLRRGLRLAAAGLMLGFVASLGLTRLLGSVVNGVGTPDAAITAIVGGVLLAIALAASYLPARWATRIDPAVALRGD